jgi:iron complex outermembrane receptor protein
LLFAGLVVAASPALAQQAEGGDQVSPVIVVAPTPLPGMGVDPNKLPAVVEGLGSSDFARTGSLAVTDALEQRIAGVSLSDTQGNDFTKDLNFRGFQASPLQGTPEGLAVYMNGVRLNEAFGDTVNWDLIPQTAIARATLFTSNPAFGLNALGGAVTLQMKTGRDAPGTGASLEGGSFGRLYGTAEYGAQHGPWSIYAAADGGHDDGWRLQSPSSVARAYADIGWSQGEDGVDLIAAGAINRFGVVGPTPADLLSQDRRAVYTYPQTTSNHEGLLALNGRFGLTDGWALQANAYLRRFDQHHLDGNDGDFVGCNGNPAKPLYGTLCVEDDDFPDAIRPPLADFQVLGPDGAPIGCPPLQAGQIRPCSAIPYGSLDRTRTAITSYGASIQATRSAPLFGRTNLFAVGGSLDRGRVRFDADSTLEIINPDLSVSADPAVPGTGQVIHTAGAIAYSPVRLAARTADWGLYGLDTIDLTDRLFLTLSGRLNLARIGMEDLTGTSPDLNGGHRFDRFNPAAGLAWRVAGALTLYGGYSEANRAPTPLELACSDRLRPCLLENALVADPPLKQVVAHTWEAGLRGSNRVGAGQFGWRLGLFQTDNDDDIVALASVIQGRGSYANAPKTRRRGMEARGQYRAGPWLAYAAYSHIDATYRFTGAFASPNSPYADGDGNIQIASGDRIGAIPADRFKAGLDLQLTSTFSLGGDVLATGPQYLSGDESNQDRRLAGYWAANLHAAYRIAPRLEFFGRIDNLFGRDYATFATYFETDALENLSPSPLPDAPNPRSLSLAPPRSLLVGLRARW